MIMSFEGNTGLGVTNHYGPRDTGGEKGSYTTQDGRRIFAIDVPRFAEFIQEAIIREGAVIENIETTGTAAVTTLTVGAQDISTATWGTPVVVTG
jgi:hypothetical protein